MDWKMRLRKPLRARANKSPAAQGNTASGEHYETVAQQFLQQQGLQLVTKNYRCRFGEIDLVMRDGSCLVFIEVRFRNSRAFGGGAGSVTIAKQRRISRTATHYLQHCSQQLDQPDCRFDVVDISIGNNASQLKIDWIRQAFMQVQ